MLCCTIVVCVTKVAESCYMICKLYLVSNFIKMINNHAYNSYMYLSLDNCM